MEIEGEIKAEITYRISEGEKMIIDHTDVDSSLKGQGIGYKLVETSVMYARDNQLKIYVVPI